MKPNAALEYHPADFDTTGLMPMGREAAGQGLLRGFVEHAGVEVFFGYGRGSAQPFASAKPHRPSERPTPP